MALFRFINLRCTDHILKSIEVLFECSCMKRLMSLNSIYLRPSTELRKFLCTQLRECCRQDEAEVKSNSRNKLHQTTYKEIFSSLYLS